MENNAQIVVRCSTCGVKNRVSPEKMKGTAKCGKCGTPLEMVRHAEPATKSPLRKSTAAPNAENAGQYLKQKNCFYPSR